MGSDNNNNVINRKDYILLKDFRKEIEVENEKNFSISFWVYLINSSTAAFPATIIKQVYSDISSNAPFLVLNEKKIMALFPFLHAHKDITNFSNSTSMEIEFPLENWIHVGCEVVTDMLRFHINGEIVGEQPQSFSLDKSSNSNGLRKITLAGAGVDDGLQGYIHLAEVLPLRFSIKDHYVKDPPLRLSIDLSSTSEIDEDSDSIWNIVGGKLPWHAQMAKAQYIAFYITVCCIAFIISKIVISVLLYKRWKRKHLIHEEDDGLSGGKMVMFKSAKMQSLKSGELWKKTLKLSYKDIIGSGGYGTVYRLMLNESTAFAVKKLNRGTAERDRGFERELEAMGDIKHRNTLTLHGYCTTPHYNLLIYELMPNGSLDTFLHGRTAETRILDWPSRYNIALGAARGIAYLHHDCIPHIIHRDIKPSNILLDQNMEAQVSDFGLATLMGPDKTHVSTLVAGTFGYLAPEYFDTGKATVKGDVYSFGVVLLEILTGRKPTDEEFYEEGTKLVTWVKAVVEQKREEYVLDSSLKCSPADEINKVFRIAFMCLEPEPSKRPTMADIVKMLEQARSERAVEEHEYLRID